MFFIYLFFGIGVLATLVLMLPSILNVCIYLISIFSNFKLERDNEKEVRQTLLSKKKEIKIAKINKKYQAKLDEVKDAKEEEVKENEVEEVEEVEEVKEEAHDEAVEDKHEEVTAPTYNYYSTEE